MACFIVPAVEAVVTSAAVKVAEKKEHKEAEEISLGKNSGATASGRHISLSRKLSWLSRMLWGGVVLLAFEHLWHGEITPWFPFITAMKSSADMMAMLHEMATVGVAMAAAVTLIWAVVCIVAERIAGREDTGAEEQA